MLLCTVRDCGLPLRREDRRWACERGHSFDISRTGYVNLLQPQDRRSRQPGDSSEGVKARRRLHDLGVTLPLLKGIQEHLKPTSDGLLLDAGCGDGFYLGNLVRDTSFSGLGIDISTPAVDAAARRYPDCQWVVANADRVVPCPSKTISVVLSITGRMNPTEFRRVLEDDGRLLVAVPAPDDLVELRGTGKDRLERTRETFEPLFELLETHRITTAADLEAPAVEDLLLSIYRPMRNEPAGAMRVTFSLDLLLFRPKKSHSDAETSEE